MNQYQPKPIKPFKSLDEEADFWDTHDTTPLFKKPDLALEKLPFIESEKEEILTMRVQKSVKKKLTQLARQQGIGPTTLARMWIVEHLRTIS